MSAQDRSKAEILERLRNTEGRLALCDLRKTELETQLSTARAEARAEALIAGQEAVDKFWGQIVYEYRPQAGNLVLDTWKAIKQAILALAPEAQPSAEGKPIGWLHKKIVNKHLTGDPLAGQIQIAGVWGTPSEHLYFTPERATEGYIWWEAPVYLGPPSQQPCAEGVEAQDEKQRCLGIAKDYIGREPDALDVAEEITYRIEHDFQPMSAPSEPTDTREG